MIFDPALITAIVALITASAGILGWWNNRLSTKGKLDSELWERTHEQLREMRACIDELDSAMAAYLKERRIRDAYNAYLLDGLAQWIEYAKKTRRKLVFTPISYTEFKAKYEADHNENGPPRPRWPLRMPAEQMT